jgi:hypothetical protein
MPASTKSEAPAETEAPDKPIPSSGNTQPNPSEKERNSMPTPESPFERVQSAMTALVDEVWMTQVITEDELFALLSLLDGLIHQLHEPLEDLCRVWGYRLIHEDDLDQAMAGSTNV